MSFSSIVGIIASILTGLALLPQLIKTVKKKKAESIAPGMLILLFGGLSFWIYYGFLKKRLDNHYFKFVFTAIKKNNCGFDLRWRILDIND